MCTPSILLITCRPSPITSCWAVLMSRITMLTGTCSLTTYWRKLRLFTISTPSYCGGPYHFVPRLTNAVLLKSSGIYTRYYPGSSRDHLQSLLWLLYSGKVSSCPVLRRFLVFAASAAVLSALQLSALIMYAASLSKIYPRHEYQSDGRSCTFSCLEMPVVWSN